MTEIPDELRQLRASIDNLDAVLIHIMAERFKLTEKVGHLKAAADLPPVSYTHLTLPTIHVECRSRWSPYH